MQQHGLVILIIVLIVIVMIVIIVVIIVIIAVTLRLILEIVLMIIVFVMLRFIMVQSLPVPATEFSISIYHPQQASPQNTLGQSKASLTLGSVEHFPNLGLSSVCFSSF